MLKTDLCAIHLSLGRKQAYPTLKHPTLKRLRLVKMVLLLVSSLSLLVKFRVVSLQKDTRFVVFSLITWIVIIKRCFYCFVLTGSSWHYLASLCATSASTFGVRRKALFLIVHRNWWILLALWLVYLYQNQRKYSRRSNQALNITLKLLLGWKTNHGTHCFLSQNICICELIWTSVFMLF
jgi:hypothetical protein